MSTYRSTTSFAGPSARTAVFDPNTSSPTADRVQVVAHQDDGFSVGQELFDFIDASSLEVLISHCEHFIN